MINDGRTDLAFINLISPLHKYDIHSEKTVAQYEYFQYQN